MKDIAAAVLGGVPGGGTCGVCCTTALGRLAYTLFCSLVAGANTGLNITGRSVGRTSSAGRQVIGDGASQESSPRDPWKSAEHDLEVPGQSAGPPVPS